MNDSHLLDIHAVLDRLQTSLSGLSTEEADARLVKYGRNELQGKKQKSRLRVFIAQFKDLMILLLCVAVVVCFISGEQVDAWVILAIILGNAVIGYVQEYRTEEAIRKLQQMAAQNAIVIRSGNNLSIATSALVPGDIIFLEAGNTVPADARVLVAESLRAEEAALTGESLSVDKRPDPLTADAVMPADQVNMVFKGTHISNGSGKAVITGTGMQTEMGKIAGMLGGDQQQTPLQKRLAAFGKHLAIIVLAICAIIFGLGIMKGEPALKMFLTAMSLAVAALPEALPVVVTIALAQGAARMVAKNALVRRLTAVETLGSVGYICSDKTGTLTQNKMTVAGVLAGKEREDLLLRAMMLNHEVKMNEQGELLGDPTETALIEYATRKGLDWGQAQEALPLVGKIPFDSERMLMTTLHRSGDGWIALVKGAPARVLDKLHSRHQGAKEQWLDQNRKWAADGHRVLFFAYKELDALPEAKDREIIEEGLDFLGMTSLIDPPREEVIDAIRECHEAGIATVMITGDQPLTAKSIAERLHIIRHEGEKVVTGAELLKMDPEEFQKRVKDIRVYARVSPGQKLNIVKALQSTGQSVAMTGDGVNDAPSLKQADIGIAMGITGTDVAKEAAHMILLDDNFATIVIAVKEGRRIYTNIRKFVQYILACNLGELLTILLAPLFGLPIPLLPIQILWINLVTDGLPGIALAAEPAEPGIMKRPPRPAKENLFAGTMIPDIISTGIIMTAGALFTQYFALKKGYNITEQQTMVFTVLCLVQLGNALSIRAGKYSVFNRFFSNPFLLWTVVGTTLLQIALVFLPFLNTVFKISRLDLQGMLIVTSITVGCMIAIELFKLLEKLWVKSN